MSFGRLGALGRGFGRLGSPGGVAGPPAPAAFTQTVFLTTTGIGSWTVPADFYRLKNVHTIAAGGTTNGLGTGPGGGAYSGSPRSALTALTASWVPGVTTVPFFVGAAVAGSNGQESVFGATSLAAAVTAGPTLAVAADAGKTNVTTTGGLGGLAANGVGATKFNGGNGGNSSQTNGGAGGAAGPFGAGGAGGPGGLNTVGAPGGGGSGGGAPGTVSATTSGGLGGANWLGWGVGTPTTSSANASAWGAGGDGSGTTAGTGAAGGNGIEWRRDKGSGGGSGVNVASGTATNTGGLYGGGGGPRSNALGGQGLVIIEYETLGVLTQGVIAANRAGIGTVTSQVFTAPSTFRTEHFASPQGDISNLQFVDLGWGFAAVTAANSGSTITIKRYIEYPVGVFTQVLWSASPTVVVAPGASVISDKCAVTIPAGAMFWERIVITAIAGTGAILQINNAGSQTNTTLGLSNGQTTGDFGNSGTVPTTGAATGATSAAAIIGDIAKTNARGFLILGDSITAEGTGDISGLGVKHGSGWAQRLLDPNFAWNVVGRGGQTTANVISSGVLLRAFLALIPNAYTDILFVQGRNDVGQSTAAQIVVNLNTVQQQFDWTAKRHIATVVPATSSTDGWATVVNQTTDAFNPVANTLNDSIRAGLPWVIGQLLELSDVVSSARNSGLWQAPPVPVADGVHPNTQRATSIAAGFTIN